MINNPLSAHQWWPSQEPTGRGVLSSNQSWSGRCLSAHELKTSNLGAPGGSRRAPYPNSIHFKLKSSTLTAHCSLPTAHCPLLTAHCSLPTPHCPLLSEESSLPSLAQCFSPARKSPTSPQFSVSNSATSLSQLCWEEQSVSVKLKSHPLANHSTYAFLNPPLDWASRANLAFRKDQIFA